MTRAFNKTINIVKCESGEPGNSFGECPCSESLSAEVILAYAPRSTLGMVEVASRLAVKCNTQPNGLYTIFQ